MEHYYIGKYNSKNTEFIILCLLHELRIMTAKQLLKLLNFEFQISNPTLQRKLVESTRNELIGRIKSGTDNKTYCYYLTKQGHNNIGGTYSFPKVPEYNLNHHLLLTDYLIKLFELVGDHPHLIVVQTERKQAYEKKDFNKELKGRTFSVSDFLFRFRSEKGRDINWYFEIELSSKTKRRYIKGIFPKYIKDLEKNYDAHLFYVTPSNYIYEELSRYKKYFLAKYGKEKEEVFDRLHIIPANRFTMELNNIVTNDPYINW